MDDQNSGTAKLNSTESTTNGHAVSDGKARQVKAGDNEAQDSRPAPSLAATLQNSVSSLARDMFSGAAPGASSTTSALAALAPSEKGSSSGGASFGSSATWAENAPSQPGRANSSISSSGPRGMSERFRESGQVASDDADFAAFEGGQEHGFDLSSDLASQFDASAETASWATQFERRELEDLQYYNAAVKGKGKAQVGDVAAIENNDGLDVVHLLNDPMAFEVEMPASASKEPSADDLFGESLSPQEAAIKSKMLATLPAPPQHIELTPDSMHNFRPDVETLYMPSTKQVQTLASSTSDMQLHAGSLLDQWMEDWDSVLRRYTDEVWGNELPKVQEAKKEIEELKKGDESLNNAQAIRRLNMILQHIRIPATG